MNVQKQKAEKKKENNFSFPTIWDLLQLVLFHAPQPVSFKLWQVPDIIELYSICRWSQLNDWISTSEATCELQWSAYFFNLVSWNLEILNCVTMLP